MSNRYDNASDEARSLMSDLDTIDLAEELAAAQAKTRTVEAERDGAYRERAHLVAWLAALHPAVIAPAPDVAEDGWHIVYITAGTWQMSWHIAPRDAALFADVEHVDADDPRAQWDGHTTEQKYDRIRQHTDAVRTAPTFARAFRLHHHGTTLDGALFPGGHALLLDLEDAGFSSSAPSMDQLLLNYPQAKVEWADQPGGPDTPVAHAGGQEQASEAPGVDESGPATGGVVQVRPELEELLAAFGRVRAATARMRVMSRTWHPAADLVDSALLGTTVSSEHGHADGDDDEPGRRTARRRDMDTLLEHAATTGAVDAARLAQYVRAEATEADIARSILADHRVETRTVRAQLAAARQQAALSDSVAAAAKELLERRTASLRTRVDQAQDLQRVAHATSNRAEAERARLAAALRQAEAAAERVRERCQAVRDRVGPGGMINATQVLGLLSPTWPDGNYEAPAPAAGDTVTLSSGHSDTPIRTTAHPEEQP
ncbi:hypothetical protein [Streptomyces corynorhini]|uniref:hypothetical protein n=1 Tax=Streptomyces corynorhini TaxID=2282652 RepID=UPI0018F530A8|nr:hypothetical protein [Streptomyces corynorhini]